MAGAKITITVDDADVRAMFARLAAFGEAPIKDAGRDIGEYMLRATRERAAQERAPDGTPWVPLSPKYAKWKAKKRPGVKMLKFDAHMLGDMFHPEVGPDYVDIGTNALYGAIHQFGGTVHHAALSHIRSRRTIGAHDVTIPARPWLGASDEDLRELGEILGDHLRAAAEGGSGG
jgi:phage virion morphogenesis protein